MASLHDKHKNRILEPLLCSSHTRPTPSHCTVTLGSKQLWSRIWNYISLQIYEISSNFQTFFDDFAPKIRHFRLDVITGKSISEVLFFVSTNPQYVNRLFIELPVQYMKIPSSEHGENIGRTWVEHVVHISCSECQNKNKKQFLYTTCSPHVLLMSSSCSPHVLSLEFSCT